ncbi:hypothetical protein JOC70_000358 [Clostridium pascui]|uniref:hypothetical protein n=1 Tax=Clostridium pascui TaxID=46609 RepID=UPI00195ED78E|nr:hypothetical protein [Clostridium pascui]MBM7868889.1 hypothetical protein [Clostridium pascui]
MQTTVNLGLKKPEGTDIVNIDDFNYNADKIDVEIKSLKDNKVDKVTGKGLSTNDYTTEEKNKLSGIASGAQTNQNAFSNVKVGTTILAADNATDTLELAAGTNISITPDATNDKVIINSIYTYTHPSTHPASMITQDTSNRFVSDTEKANWNGKANGTHTHTKSQITDMPTKLSEFTKDINFDERYYTETEINNKLTSMYKAASSTFTTRGTSHIVTDSFCTTASLVTVVITGTVDPQGVWKVESQAGKFVITSDASEVSNITFDYYIQKGAV